MIRSNTTVSEPSETVNQNSVSLGYGDPAFYLEDIPESLAYAAHSGTSWVPERRTVTTRQEYAELLAGLFRKLEATHAKTEEKRAQLRAEWARFREGFQRRYRAYLASRSRVVSWAIAGPSNFPVARMAKRSDVAHRRLNEVLTFQKAATEAIIRDLHPEWRPIMAGDADAVERLERKIEGLEQLQERMKAANLAIRKNHKSGRDAQVLALLAIGFSEVQAGKLLTPDCFGGLGFPSYALTNNSAELRRSRARLSQIRAAKATPATTIEGANARLEDCPADNRVRLFFPGKPARATREALSTAGFRWTPSLEAWQAYRNFNSLAAARQFAGVAA